MTRPIDKRMRFMAQDKVSGVVDRITRKFPKMSKAVTRTQKNMDRLNRSSARLKKNLKGMGGGMKSVGATMAAGLTLPIVAFGASAFRASVTFERSMNKVEALTGATGKELKNMTDLAKKMGQTTKFKASEAADAMSFLGMAGFKTNEILAATPGVMALAAATNTDLARSADIASNILGAFGLKANKMNHVADVLAATTASANVNMEQLAETMKHTAPIAKMYGLTLEETAAVTGLLGNVGIQGSVAGTALKNMMLRLAAPGTKARKVMKRLGVEVLDSSGKLLKINKVLKNLGPALKKLPQGKQLAVMNELFGKRAIAGAGELLTQSLAIGKDGKNSIERYTESLEKASEGMGIAAKQAKTLQKGLPGALDRMMSAFESFQLSVFGPGTALNKFFQDAFQGLTNMFIWLSKLNPTILKWGAIIAGVVAIMGPLIFVLSGIISALPFIIAGFEALVVIFPLLGIGLIPILIIMAKFILIAGLIAGAAYLIIKHWAPIKDFFNNLWDGIVSKTMGALTKMKDGIAKVKGFFGFSSDESENKKSSPGPIGSGVLAPSGTETGSKELTKKNFEFFMRKQQASVDVKFSDLPQGTKVMSEDRESILNIDTGMMGAF